MGLWGVVTAPSGSDDVEMRPVAGANLVRREGCPLRVRTNEDGSVEYTGKARTRSWVESTHGSGFRGEGGYEVYHAGPPSSS